MPDEKPPTPLPDRIVSEVSQRVATASAAAAGKQALDAVEGAVHGALDTVESFLFGKVGGAEEAMREGQGESALDRARRQYGLAPNANKPAEAAPAATPPTATKAESALDRAKRELAELKAAATAKQGGSGAAAGSPGAPASPPEPAPRKKTL